MTMRGDLKEMSLVDLIQVNCTERKRARLRVRGDAGDAYVYFDNGEVVHAVSRRGEGNEALYDLLKLHTGPFELVNGEEAPRRTVEGNWTGLLLEGMRRIDTSTRPPVAVPPRNAVQPERSRPASAPETPTAAATSPRPTTSLAATLRALPGVSGAVVVDARGAIESKAGAVDDAADGAVASFVGSAAAEIGRALGLGNFRTASLVLGNRHRQLVSAGSRSCSLSTDQACEDELVRRVEVLLGSSR